MNNTATAPIPCPAGRWTVVFEPISWDAWAIRVNNGGPVGDLVDLLSRPWPTEATARVVGRFLVRHLRAVPADVPAVVAEEQAAEALVAFLAGPALVFTSPNC